jgi:glycosyltransferase involved in cell wall biosynthesis
MKVLLVSNYENDTQESMQRFAALLAHGLSEVGHEVRTLRPPSLFGGLYPSGQGLGKWLGYLDKFFIFPSVLRSAGRWADIIHICDHSNSFYTKYLDTFPHIVTCHDLLAIRSARGEVLQNRTGWSGRQLQRMIVRGLIQARHVVCVSEATRRDLLRITGIPEERVSRIYNSLNYPYSPMSRQEATDRLLNLSIDPKTPFLLHVGGNQWYKNRLGVLQIFPCLWTWEMRRFVGELGMTDSVLELTGIANEDLQALYSTATMLLFPSLQEGFGWPIIEAQACGCPVVTSDRPPMDEVGGEAAIYVDPEDLESAARTIRTVLEKASCLSRAGLRNAARFNMPAMIDSYVTLYGRIHEETVGVTSSMSASRRSVLAS